MERSNSTNQSDRPDQPRPVDFDLPMGVLLGDLPADADELESAPPRPEIPPGDIPQDQRSSLSSLETELLAEVSQDEAEPLVVADVECDLRLPDSLMQVLSVRVKIWNELLNLEEARHKVRAQASAREIRDELARQDRELQRSPTAEMLKNSLEQLARQQQNITLPSLAGKERPPRRPGELSPEDIYRKALELGTLQCRLLLKRELLDAEIITAALPAAAGEPLFELCNRLQIDAAALFGWTFYAIGLFQQINHFRKIEEAYNAKVAAARAEANSAGLMTRLRDACLGREELPRLDPQVRKTRAALEKELRSIEGPLTEMFWAVYPDVAWALCSGALEEPEKPTARALLRYGAVAVHPGILPPALREHIMADCAADVYAWQNRTDALHVVYADEYIQAIHDRSTSVSPDEDMELNARGTETWKADRIWRQAAISGVLARLYESRLAELHAEADQLSVEREKQEKEYAAIRGSTTRRAQATALGEELAKTRATLARLRQAIERFENKLVPDVTIRANDAAERIKHSFDVLTPEMVVRREAQFVRRLARLTARLKEPYPPFVLREWFSPGRSDHYNRKLVTETIQKLEKNDPRVFHQVLIPNKKLDRRVTVRMSPTFLIVPGRGQMGLSLCPRQWDDCGRLILPLMFQRQNGLENILIEMLADFRWDCSREEAGMDWLTADALCAAYATVRWNHRRLSEEAQKATGMDKKLKDKQNWRIHYRLYMTSAQERGRYLFSKCHDVYKDVVLRYMGLPAGIEPLRRD